MARIPYYDPEQADPDARELIERLPKLNIFRMLGHAGRAGADFIRLGSSILLKGRLDPMLREMAIIRTGILCGSSYEVHQHTEIWKRAGLPREKLEALREGPSSPAFTGLERLVLIYTEEVVTGCRAQENTFSALDLAIGHGCIAELTIAIGYYRAVSCFLESFGVEIEGEPGRKDGGA